MLLTSPRLMARDSERPGVSRTIRSIIFGPAGRVLVITLVAYFCFLQYYKITYWKDPSSVFFNERKAYENGYSQHRKHEARRMIAAANSTDESKIPDGGWRRYVLGPAPSICVGIPAVYRGPDNDYLRTAVGSLLEGLYFEERMHIYVMVVFANTDPRSHPDFNSLWTERLLDNKVTYNVTAQQLNMLSKAEWDGNWGQKRLFDYSLALEQCYNTQARYAAIFEDDIVAADGWMAKTLRALNTKLRHQEDWLYLRLFYSDHIMTSTPTDVLHQNMQLTIVLAVICSYVSLVALRWKWPGLRKHIDNYAIAAVCLVTVPTFTALASLTSKYSVTALEGIVEMNNNSPSTSQALVYPRVQIPNLITALRDRGKGSPGTFVDMIAEEKNLERYALAPQQIQHIGLKSGKKNPWKNQPKYRDTFAYFFEKNDPQLLKVEHHEAVAAGIAWFEQRKPQLEPMHQRPPRPPIGVHGGQLIT